MNLSYSDRANFCKAPIAQQLLRLLDQKKTNLALSADVTESEELIYLAETLGPEICLLKTHIDIVKNFTPALTKQLSLLAKKHDFFLFEDRKFADIGHTVSLQYQGGMYAIADWAHIINAHALPGSGLIKGLAEVGMPKNRALLLVAELSSAENLIDKNYTLKSIQLAEMWPDFVMGFIAQNVLKKDPRWVYFTPGIQIAADSDDLGQRYITPETAIETNGTDVIIVGRGILLQENPLNAAKLYRARGWESYLRRCLPS